jgi:hypothetical protein
MRRRQGQLPPEIGVIVTIAAVILGLLLAVS